jgi:hypothetical protein
LASFNLLYEFPKLYHTVEQDTTPLKGYSVKLSYDGGLQTTLHYVTLPSKETQLSPYVCM